MRRYLGLFVVLLAFTSIACPPAPKEEPDKKDPGTLAPMPPPPENMEALRPRIEAALDQVRSRDLVVEHGFWTVFHGILGTGIENTMIKDPKTKQRVNAMDFIREGGELPGLEFVPTRHGLDVRTVDARVNADQEFFGQGHQDQFIAEMA